MYSSALSSSGRAACLPLTPWSMNILSHPSAASSSTWLSSHWFLVLTLAYPILAISPSVLVANKSIVSQSR